jgi:hypothetical protein
MGKKRAIMNVIVRGTAAAAVMLACAPFTSSAHADPVDIFVTSADQQTLPLGEFQSRVCRGQFDTVYCAQLVAGAPNSFWLGGTARDDQQVITGNGKPARLGDLQHAVCDPRSTQPFAQCAAPIAANPGGYGMGEGNR